MHAPASDHLTAATGVDTPPALPAVAPVLRSLWEASTPIGLDPARAAVAGKTDKPYGVDPVLHLSEQGAYRIGAIPLALFVPNEEGLRYDATVDQARVDAYMARETRPGEGIPPVIATVPRKDPAFRLRILDGGHRLSAARARGDTHILSIVNIRSVPAEWLAELEHGEEDTPVQSPGMRP